MQNLLYILSAILLLLAAHVVFRRIVRRDYMSKGGLTWFSSALQLVIFFGLFCFPYIYNPPGWDLFWRLDGKSDTYNKIFGFILILLGFFLALGTMFWFGIRRAFGFEVNGLKMNGPYRYSRNPQILGGYLLVIGVALQYPTWYALGWVILYGAIGHMMIRTEEEFLRDRYGIVYERYCEEVPRYVLSYKNIQSL